MELIDVEDYVPGTAAQMDLSEYWIHIVRSDQEYVETHPATRFKEWWFDPDQGITAYAFELKDGTP